MSEKCYFCEHETNTRHKCSVSNAGKRKILSLVGTIKSQKEQIDRLTSRGIEDMQNEIRELRSGIIKVSAQLLIKRPFPDVESSKRELLAVVELAAEDMRVIGIEAKKLCK